MGRCIIEQKGLFLKEVRHCDQSRAKTREAKGVKNKSLIEYIR